MFNKNDKIIVLKKETEQNKDASLRESVKNVKTIKNVNDTLFSTINFADLNGEIPFSYESFFFSSETGKSLNDEYYAINLTKNKSKALEEINKIKNRKLKEDEERSNSEIDALEKEMQQIKKSIFELKENGINKKIILEQFERYLNEIHQEVN